MKRALEKELKRLTELYTYYLIMSYKTFDYDTEESNGYPEAMFKVREQMYDIKAQLEVLKNEN